MSDQIKDQKENARKAQNELDNQWIATLLPSLIMLFVGMIYCMFL